jgi:hypothetical protein
MAKLKFIVIPVTTFLLITIVAVALSLVNYSWSHWKPATCMPVNCFCEAIRSGTVAQPANTWSRFSSIRRHGFVTAFVALNLVLGYALVQFPAFRRYLFGALIVAALWVEHLVRRKRNFSRKEFFIHAAVLMLILAFILWVLDITKTLCLPHSWLQGHALWHLLCAIAAGSLYLYYRTEEVAESNSLPENCVQR